MLQKYFLLSFLISLLLLPVSLYGEESAGYLAGSTFIAVVKVSDPVNKYGNYLVVNSLSEAVKDKISDVEKYFTDRAPPDLKLSFNHQFFDANINYIPDYGPNSNSNWVEDSIKNLGYYDSDNDGSSIDDFTKSLKLSHPTNKIVIIFVPAIGPQGNILGGASGYASPSMDDKEYAVIYAYNIPGVLAMGSSIYVHEISHLFGAYDEYSKYLGGTGCDGGEISSWANEPMKTYYPNYNCQLEYCNEKSVMQSGDFISLFQDWFNISTPIDFWSMGMMGWLDFDMNGIKDPYDNKTIEFVNHAPVKRVGLFEGNIKTSLAKRIISFRTPEITSYSVWSGGTGKNSPTDHNVYISFIAPDQTSIQTYDATISKSCSDNEVKSTLKLNNIDKFKLPGVWKVKVSYDNQIIYYDSFRVTVPVIQVNPSSKNFGTVYKGQMMSTDFQVYNKGDDYLSLLSTKIDGLPEGSVIIQPSMQILNPMVTTSGKIVVDTRKPGGFSGFLTAISDDPINPTKTVALSGYIKELSNLSINTMEKYMEVGKPIEFIIAADGNYVDNVNVRVGSKVFNTGSSDRVNITFDNPGKYSLIASRDNTTVTDYTPASFEVNIMKRRVVSNLSIKIDKIRYVAGEVFSIQVLANYQPVQANVEYNNITQKTDLAGRLNIVLNQPQNMTITAFKDVTENNKEIINYAETSIEVHISQPKSSAEVVTISIDNIIKYIMNFFSLIFGKNK